MNGSYGYAIAGISGYHQSTLPDGTVVVDGSSVSEPTLLSGSVTYSVGFTESGLPSGTLWSVTLNGDTENSTGVSIGFSESNGTYAYSIGGVAGYTAAPSSGSVDVREARSRQGLPSPRHVHRDVQRERPTGRNPLVGDPPGGHGDRDRTVDRLHGTGRHVPATPSGHRGYFAAPSSGSVTVDGADVSAAIVFTPVTYSVTFSESGLPSGTLWSVTLNGRAQSSTGTAITFTEPNGTYRFSIGGITGYRATPNSGSVSVDGADTSVAIGWTQVTYTVTFTESGLASATLWSVTLNGVTLSTAGTSIIFSEPNGTFGYTVGGVAGYRAAPSAGSVTVNGADGSAAVVFTQVTYAVTFSETAFRPG